MSRSVSRRLLLSALMATAAFTTLSACSSVLDGKRTIYVDGDKLQQKLAARFPVTRTVLGIAPVTISQPQLRFDAGANKLGTRLQLAVPAMFGLTPELQGPVDVSYNLRYETSDNSVRMTNVQVLSVDMKDMQGHSHARVNSMLSRAGEQFLQDYTLYKLTDADLAKARHYNYIPSGITVKRKGVDVELAPRP